MIHLLVVNEVIDSRLVIDNFIKPYTRYITTKKFKDEQLNFFAVNSFWQQEPKLTNNIVYLRTFISSRVFELFFPLSIFFILSSILTGIRIAFKFPNKTTEVLVLRGYHGICIAITVLLLRSKIKLIFDPRSLYIEESVYANRFSNKSYAYRFWKFLESIIIDRSTAVLCVGEAHAKYYKNLSTGVKIYITPITAESFRKITVSEMEHIKCRELLCKKLKISLNRKVVLYYGSVDYGWNNIKYYEKFIQNNMENYYIFISQSGELIRDKFSEYTNVLHIQLDSWSVNLDIDDILRAVDCGIFFLGPAPDWRTRLGVKFVFYAVNGIPVILTNYVGEAISVARSNNFEAIDVLDYEGIGDQYSISEYSMAQRYNLQKKASSFFSDRAFFQMLDELLQKSRRE